MMILFMDSADEALSNPCARIPQKEMLRIQAESVGTGASGVKKKSCRQLLDAAKENNDKLCKRGLVAESGSDYSC
jgi:hypothetical protein